jgi:hypothetical protein
VSVALIEGAAGSSAQDDGESRVPRSVEDCSLRRGAEVSTCAPARGLYEGGRVVKWGAGRRPGCYCGVPGEGGRVKRAGRAWVSQRGREALDAAGGVWHSVRVLVRLVDGERRSSLYRLLGGRIRRHGRPAAGAQFQKGRQAARRRAAPPAAGLKGWLVVSMCQIASVSLLAMSICATLAPRWRPRRALLRR